MPAIPSTPPFPVRRGVTLLELLVVLVLMAVAASVVLPVLGTRPADARGAELSADRSALDVVIARARRSAIQRGAPVQLRVARDGVWALAAATDGELLSAGRLDDAAVSDAVQQPVDLQIDAMGSCLPAANTLPGVSGSTSTAQSTPARDARARPTERAYGRSFDALACRFAPDTSP